jgi:hypothetical protein
MIIGFRQLEATSPWVVLAIVVEGTLISWNMHVSILKSEMPVDTSVSLFDIYFLIFKPGILMVTQLKSITFLKSKNCRIYVGQPTSPRALP